MKVRILEEEQKWDLENKVNIWLNENSYKEIVDIKYSGRGYSVPHGTSHMSVMIIYK